MLTLRRGIAALAAAIVASHEETAAEDPQLLRISLWLWAVIALAVLLVGAAML